MTSYDFKKSYHIIESLDALFSNLHMQGKPSRCLALTALLLCFLPLCFTFTLKVFEIGGDRRIVIRKQELFLEDIEVDTEPIPN